MASGSNVYKPKLTGALIAAILLVMVVIVILISTVLILTARSEGATTTAPTPVWTPSVTTTGSAPTSNKPAGTTVAPSTSDPDNPPPVIPTNTLTVSKNAVSEGSLVQADENHFYHREGLIAYKDMTAMTAGTLGFGALSSSSENYSLSKGNLYLTYDARDAFETMAAVLTAEVGNALQVRNAYYYDATISISNFRNDIEAVEHSTGLYVDLQVYANGKVYPLEHPDYNATYLTWLTENCWKYGFVHVRNTANYSTFRYVGKAHAAAMEKNNLNLSTYLATVAAYNFDNRMKVTDGDGHEWWIYYVLADADTVQIPVLGDERAYTVSGDGVNGFVVAIDSSVFA